LPGFVFAAKGLEAILTQEITTNMQALSHGLDGEGEV
jgi:hypothetical protein